jgi:ABC-2 type transport system permease protein
MNAWYCVFARELRHYFVTPIAYVVIASFWAASGFFFSFNVLFVSAVEMVTAFHNMSLLLMLMMPLISMRTFAEERHNDTLELLLTLPLGEFPIVLAKYSALLVVLLLMLAGSSAAVVVLTIFGEPDYGPIIGGYLGVFLLGAVFASIGVLVSALSTNQVVAAIATWASLLFLWFMDYLAALFPGSDVVVWIQHLSLSVQYLDVIRGVLTLAAVTYFVSIISCALVTATQIVAMKRL